MKISESAKSKSQNVYNMIKHSIIVGELAPEQELIEAELCEKYDASRTPIRNALVKLEADGLLDNEPNKGCRVSAITFQFATEVLDTRTALESHALRICCRKKDPKIIETLYRLVLQQKECLASGKKDEFIEMDVYFHRTIVESCGNSIWLSFWETVMVHIHRILTISMYRDTVLESAVDVHSRLIKSIASGDEEAVTKEITNHFNDLRGDLLDKIIR